MKIALVVHPHRETAAALAATFAAEAALRGIEVLASSRDATRLQGLSTWCWQLAATAPFFRL
jgi:hypothetical protein